MSDLFDVAEYAVAHGITLAEAEEICGDVLPLECEAFDSVEVL